MMINKLIYFVILISSLFLWKCTEDLDVGYIGSSNDRLIVYGKITTDTMRHTVKLSRSLDYSSSEEKPERNATVTISDGDTIFSLKETSAGTYQTDSTVYGIPGKTYTLSIELENDSVYTATAELLPITGTDSIRVKKEYFSFMDEYYYKVYFFGQEPAGKGDYYLWNLYLNDSLYNDTINETAFESDEWVDGAYIHDFDVYWVEEDAITKDTTDVMLEMYSLTEDYYMFLFELMSETTWRGGPFDPTPANVRTNISNSGLGYFSAHAISRGKFRYIKSKEEGIPDN